MAARKAHSKPWSICSLSHTRCSKGSLNCEYNKATRVLAVGMMGLVRLGPHAVRARDDMYAAHMPLRIQQCNHPRVISIIVG